MHLLKILPANDCSLIEYVYFVCFYFLTDELQNIVIIEDTRESSFDDVIRILLSF
jgi:hypothetical protein